MCHEQPKKRHKTTNILELFESDFFESEVTAQIIDEMTKYIKS